MTSLPPDLLPGDLTAKARIREAALDLFAARGFDATSVRQIAGRAGVSPGLVLHHFGSKQGVRDAVDASVIAHFEAGLDNVDLDQPAELVSRGVGDAFAAVITASPALRAYLRRAVLDGNDTGNRILGHIADALERGIERMSAQGMLRPAVVTRWLPFQVMFNALGTLLFEPFLQRRLGGHAYDPEVVAERGAANVELMARGMVA